ncbi:lipopolysaccharide biosynthesis protein [Microtetraspora niveoalba]|uniref:lipopolysaccharide biosynthesis protein n=1 Tax=Microtetraspora niveoalba TaxID=46175 RepID=UPI000A7AD531|nr:polysaccharide biosynthesis C-terminal domain-containing protein [Microtetraspora niveoalba]
MTRRRDLPLARKSAAGLLWAATGAAAQFLLALVVTRSLSPAHAGAFFAATALCLMLAGIVRLDTGNGLVYFLAGQADDPAPAGRPVLLVALAPVVALSLVVAVAVAAFGGLLAPLVGVPAGVWPVLAAALPAVAVADVLIAATRGLGSMRPTLFLSGVAQPLGQVALLSGGLLAGAPVPVLTAAWALPALPVGAVAARRLRGRTMTVRWGRFWRYTGPRSAAAAIQAVFQRLDVVIVAALAGPAPAAVYTAATRFKVVGQLAGQGLAQAVQPGLVRALSQGDLDRARQLYQTATMWLVMVTWPVWLGYAALAPWLLRIFGTSYARGTSVALVLSATMMIASACGMVDVMLIASGHTTASLVNTACAVSVTVVLDVLLVPGHGALGAALGWSGGVLVKNLLPLAQISVRYGLRPFGRHSLAAFGLRVAA